MKPEQCRMARAGLGLGVRELAEMAQVAPGTITRLEKGEGLYPRTVEMVQAALEAAGAKFVSDQENGSGVFVKITTDL